MSASLLIAPLVAVIGTFGATMLVLQRWESHLDEQVDVAQELMSASIERLTGVTTATLERSLALQAWLHAEGPDRDVRLRRLDASRARAEEQVQSYRRLEVLPGERSYWLAVQESLVRLDEAVQRTRLLATKGDVAGARALYTDAVEPAVANVAQAASLGLAYDIDLGRTRATSVEEARERTRWLANAFMSLGMLLSLGGGWLVHRQMRLRRVLETAHASMLEARAAELEQFAGRVAHDIRNPLAAAKLAIELLQRDPSEERTKVQSVRLARAIARAEAITAGLLEFARAGARNPDPGARVSARELVDDVATGLAPDAERAGVELRVDAIPPVLVACGRGVYMSLLGNLIRNALKYMGESTTRRVVVRVIDEGTRVRTEVVDTGPGIPEELQASLFELYHQADRARQDGLGLGLATVKKLVEGHGGRAGVKSRPGMGSTFWFDLPCAGIDSEPPLEDQWPDDSGPPMRH